MEDVQESKELSPVQPAKPPIETDEHGVLRPANLDEAYRMAVAFHKSKLLPTRFNSPEMILTAVQFVSELGLKPLTALRQLAVINGTPSLFGDLPLSLCFSNGKLEYIKEWFIEKSGKEICVKHSNLDAEVWGAVCIVKRKGDLEPLESFFSLGDAERAGLFKNPVWKSYPKRMLRYRARSQALKDKFPDALNGISIAEYDFNTLPNESDGAKVTKSIEADYTLTSKLVDAPEKPLELKDAKSPTQWNNEPNGPAKEEKSAPSDFENFTG